MATFQPPRRRTGRSRQPRPPREPGDLGHPAGSARLDLARLPGQAVPAGAPAATTTTPAGAPLPPATDAPATTAPAGAPTVPAPTVPAPTAPSTTAAAPATTAAAPAATPTTPGARTATPAPAPGAPTPPAGPGAPPGSRAGGAPPALVTLRPIASGLPLGFFGLVGAATIVGAQAYGILPLSASQAIGMLLLPTVLIQLVGGISCISGRDVLGATLMLTFSGVWLGTALVDLVNPPHGPTVLGIWYFAIGPLILGIIGAATGKLALSAVPAIGLPTFVLTGVWLVWPGASLGRAVGILTFCLAFAALYAAIALLLEDARRRPVLPTLRRGAMREAFTGDFPAQLRGVEHEAGVRRYL